MSTFAVGEVVVAETGTSACDVGHGLLSSLWGGGGPVTASASAATSPAARTSPAATLVAGPVNASDCSHHRMILFHHGGDVAASSKIVRPEGVSTRSQLGKRRDTVL